MTAWDSPDLLRRCQRLARRPETDADMQPADWYDLLTQAEAYWVPQFAAHVPEVLYGPPEKMTTPDGGHTYEVAHWPYGRMEITDRLGGILLRIGASWDSGTDGAWEGKGFRVPNGRSRTFPDGPYARYVRGPATIDAGTESAIQPPHARMLLVYHAVAEWASQGGFRDPAPYLALAQSLWSGDPDRPGDTGLLGALKTAVYGAGQASTAAETGAWWRSSDLGGR